jgi:hypothetical protein
LSLPLTLVLTLALTLALAVTLTMTLTMILATLQAENYEEVPNDLVKLSFVPAEKIDELRASGLTVALAQTIRIAAKGGGPKGAMKRLVAENKVALPAALSTEPTARTPTLALAHAFTLTLALPACTLTLAATRAPVLASPAPSILARRSTLRNSLPSSARSTHQRRPRSGSASSARTGNAKWRRMPWRAAATRW